MNNYSTYIATAIKGKAKEWHMSLNELSRRTGISHQQLFNIIGGSNTTIHTLCKILDALGMEMTISQKAHT